MAMLSGFAAKVLSSQAVNSTEAKSATRCATATPPNANSTITIQSGNVAMRADLA